MSGAIARTLQVVTVLVALAGLSLGAVPIQKTPGPATRDLKDRIEYGLETSPVVKRYDLKVKVDGVDATLTGTVATEAQKAEALRLAKVAGATRIQNGIVVDKDVDQTLADRMKAGLSKTGDKITDAWITTKVKWFYFGDDLLKGSDINVDTADRVVTLKGTVKTQAGRARAVALATDTEGVKRVIDTLTIPK